MAKLTRAAFIGLAAALIPLLGAAAAAGKLAARGYSPRPPGSKVLSRTILDDSFRLFHDGRFKGGSVGQHPVTKVKPHRVHRIDKEIKDEATSLCWSLYPGVVVVMYEHGNGRGQQFVMWGDGQVASLRLSSFNDKATSWAWFYVGGVDNPPDHLAHARATRPTGSRPTRRADDSMLLYGSDGFRGLSRTLKRITDRPGGELQHLGDMDSLRSLRWNLPPGVVVVFYKHTEARGKQFAVWGKGEVRSLSRWGGDGTVTNWAWFFVGSPAEEPPAPEE